MAEIVLEGVSKVFADGSKAVNSVDLYIPTASSTSSSVRRAAGRRRSSRSSPDWRTLTEGSVRIGNRIVDELPRPKDRDVAMVFQNYALYPHMTV